MAELSTENLESVLRLIAGAGPGPWYPKVHAESSGVDRDSLDAPLEKLRLAGMVRLTDWVKDHGQGYVLTPEGMTALNDGKTLARVRDGKISQAAAVPAPKGKPRWSAWDRGEAIREVFLSPPNAVVAKTILFITVLLFIAGMYAATRAAVPANLYLFGSGLTERQMLDLLTVKHTFGALMLADLIQGQWWRLLTYILVHHGLLHLALNMFALYTLGKYVEPMWGRARFLILYLVAGWGGGCAAMIFTPNALLGGASGSICGLLAAEGAWVVLNREYLPGPLFKSLMQNLFVNTILIVIISAMPNVSASGHFGGAAAGAVAAIFLHYQRYGMGAVRWLAPLGLALLVLGGTGALVYTMHHSAIWQEKQAILEDKALRDRLGDLWPAYKESRLVFANALEDVLQLNPTRRDAEKKEQTIAALAKARADLEAASTTFAADLNIKTEQNAEKQRWIVKLLEAQIALLRLAEDYLTQDVNLLNEADQALDQRQREVSEAITELQHLGVLKH
jgi:membrane associated rhomboid family serine protease